MTNMWGGAVVLVCLVCAFGCTTQQPPKPTRTHSATRKAQPAAKTRQPYADAHVHIIDFLQNGAFDNSDKRFAGIGDRGQILKGKAIRYLAVPYGQQWRRLTLLLKDMDAANVDHAMVSGMPFLKKWSENEPFARPRYYLDSSSRMVHARDTDYMIGGAYLDYKTKFAEKPKQLRQLDRLYPFVCGFDSTDLGAVDLVIKRIKEYPGVWKGIGEVMSRHDDLTNLTTGQRPRGNHPALKRLCRFAGDVSLPVSIHHNIAPISRSETEVKRPVYIDELVELFRYCPQTKFIWCHAGISRRVTIDNLHHWIGAVLSEFAGNVTIDLSWVVYEDYIAKNLDAWAKLIRKYPKSFVLGSDVVGGAKNMGAELGRYEPLLDKISPDPNDKVRRNLVRDNFVNLMSSLGKQRRARMHSENLITDQQAQSGRPGDSGLILKADFEFPENAHAGVPAESFLQKHKP